MADITFKVSPDALKQLSERINNASEDLQKDIVEIQYLLSQLNASLSGAIITEMTHDAMSEITHCEQLRKTLHEFSSDVQKIAGIYQSTESSASVQIQAGLSTFHIL